MLRLLPVLQDSLVDLKRLSQPERKALLVATRRIFYKNCCGRDVDFESGG